MGDKFDDSTEYFFPCLFSEDGVPWNKDYYDFNEFIFYVFIIPSILCIIYKRFPKPINKLVNWLLNNR